MNAQEEMSIAKNMNIPFVFLDQESKDDFPDGILLDRIGANHAILVNNIVIAYDSIKSSTPKIFAWIGRDDPQRYFAGFLHGNLPFGLGEDEFVEKTLNGKKMLCIPCTAMETPFVISSLPVWESYVSLPANVMVRSLCVCCGENNMINQRATLRVAPVSHAAIMYDGIKHDGNIAICHTCWTNGKRVSVRSFQVGHIIVRRIKTNED